MDRNLSIQCTDKITTFEILAGEHECALYVGLSEKFLSQSACNAKICTQNLTEMFYLILYNITVYITVIYLYYCLYYCYIFILLFVRSLLAIKDLTPTKNDLNNILLVNYGSFRDCDNTIMGRDVIDQNKS